MQSKIAKLLLLALIALVGLLALVGMMDLAVPDASAQSKIKGELVKVKTEDGITLNGALWTPSSGKARIGIVIAAGASEFYSDWLTWLGERFAQAGYVALAMNRRDHGSQHGYHDFEPSALDHKHMVDLLAARGAETVILAGHSYGTVTVSYYVRASNDPRVKALILYAPLGDLRAEQSRALEYDKLVAKAREMVAAGRGEDSFLMPFPGGRPALSTYKTFLNKRGPDAKTAPIELLKQVGDRPVLGIRDPADPLPATLPPAEQQLKAANKNLEYVLLPDIRSGKMDAAAHQFRGREEEVFRITLDWIKKHKLGS